MARGERGKAWRTGGEGRGDSQYSLVLFNIRTTYGNVVVVDIISPYPRTQETWQGVARCGDVSPLSDRCSVRINRHTRVSVPSDMFSPFFRPSCIAGHLDCHRAGSHTRNGSNT